MDSEALVLRDLSLKDLTAFIKKVLVREDFDVVIPVERRASVIIRSLIKHLPKIGSVVWDSEYLTDDSLRNKRVLIFDDSVMSGQTMRSILQEVQKHHPRIVKTSAYVVSTRAPLKPDFTARKLRPEQVALATQRLLEDYASLGEPFETDSLIIRTIISRSVSIAKLHNLLKDLGDTYQTSIRGRKYSVGLLPDKVLRAKKIQGVRVEKSIYKVRLYLHRSKKLVVVPQVYPEISFSESFTVGEIAESRDIKEAFGPLNDSGIPSERVCVDFIVASEQIELARWILRILVHRLNNQGMRLKIVGVEWPIMTSRYPKFQTYLTTRFFR